MNDNYLWDRSGEPDAEIRELEELLGTLKYQPRTLQIPATMLVGRKRHFIPLAIAAAMALVMIAAGLWIRFSSAHDQSVIQARDDQPANQTKALWPPDQVANSVPPEQITKPDSARKPKSIRIARNNPRHIRAISPALTEQELAEKDQVLIALRLASAKLNLAQRKTVALPQANTIRN